MANQHLVQWRIPEQGALDTGPPIKLIKVRPNNTVRGFFLSDQVNGVSTHWMGGRTKPCIGAGNGCEGCKIGLPIRAKGYIAVAVDSTAKIWLLEITEKAFDSNLRLCATSGLRGLYFEARRVGPNINSGLDIAIFDNKKPATPLPEDINVRAVLCRIWFGREKSRSSTGGGD